MVVLDGLYTYVRDTPATAPGAEPALYVHGLGGSSTNWTDLAGLLTDRLDGQAVDLPGFGRSGPGRSYTLAAFADRVARLIEHEGRGPVHLFGNSMGGAAAVLLAGTRPELVRTLTLISPAMPFLDPRRSAQGRLVPLLYLPGIPRLAARRMAAMDPADMVQMVLDTCWADPGRLVQSRRAEALEEIRLRNAAPWYMDAYFRSMRGLVGSFLRSYLPGEGSLWRTARRITAPTLIIAGRQDRIVDIRVAPAVGKVIPDSRLLMLEGVGHVPQMEVPHTVARAVLGLLDELGAALPSKNPEAAGGEPASVAS